MLPAFLDWCLAGSVTLRCAAASGGGKSRSHPGRRGALAVRAAAGASRGRAATARYGPERAEGWSRVEFGLQGELSLALQRLFPEGNRGGINVERAPLSARFYPACVNNLPPS